MDNTGKSYTEAKALYEARTILSECDGWNGALPVRLGTYDSVNVGNGETELMDDGTIEVRLATKRPDDYEWLGQWVIELIMSAYHESWHVKQHNRLFQSGDSRYERMLIDFLSRGAGKDFALESRSSDTHELTAYRYGAEKCRAHFEGVYPQSLVDLVILNALTGPADGTGNTNRFDEGHHKDYRTMDEYLSDLGAREKELESRRKRLPPIAGYPRSGIRTNEASDDLAKLLYNERIGHPDSPVLKTWLHCRDGFVQRKIAAAFTVAVYPRYARYLTGIRSIDWTSPQSGHSKHESSYNVLGEVQAATQKWLAAV